MTGLGWLTFWKDQIREQDQAVAQAVRAAEEAEAAAMEAKGRNRQAAQKLESTLRIACRTLAGESKRQ